MSALHELGLEAAAGAIRTGAVSARELARHLLDRVEGHCDLGAFVTLNEHLEEEATAVDARRVSGARLGPLAGVPIAVKDNIVTRDLPTTSGSRLLESWRAPYDATVIERLRSAGALVLGKTNLDEFGMGSSTETSAWGPTRNPWDLTRTPGGSSGGSAAAVAARLAPAALGSDTGGSVRQPAALTGVVGLKPGYGRVSRYGLVAFGSSLDQVGTFTRSARDAALLLSVLAGHDPRDGTTRDEIAPEAGPARSLEGLRIGVATEYMQGVDEDVREVIEHTLARAREAGAQTIDVALPHTRYAIAAYYVVANAEASSNLARYDGVAVGRTTGLPRQFSNFPVDLLNSKSNCAPSPPGPDRFFATVMSA